MNSTVAFEIGGAFFLAVLFMAGTMTGGVFPKIGKNIKITLCCGSVLVLCYITLSNWSDAMAGMASIFSDSLAPTAKSVISTSTAAPPRPTARAAKSANKTTSTASEIEYVVKVAPSTPTPVEPTLVETKAAPDAEAKPEKKNVFHKIGGIFRKKKKDDN